MIMIDSASISRDADDEKDAFMLCMIFFSDMSIVVHSSNVPICNHVIENSFR